MCYVCACNVLYICYQLVSKSRVSYSFLHLAPISNNEATKESLSDDCNESEISSENNNCDGTSNINIIQRLFVYITCSHRKQKILHEKVVHNSC